MNIFAPLSLLAAVVSCSSTTAAAAAAAAAVSNLQEENVPEFESWKQHHNYEYSSDREHALRQRIWTENRDLVARHNAAYEKGHTSWKMSILSPFADLTADEFAVRYLMDPQECSATKTKTQPGVSNSRTIVHKDDPSVSVDWRTKGIMTPVKDQGHCGSCWTFSTSGCLEAHTCLAYNKDCTHWKGLAEQQLVDCAGGFNNFGCSGGLPSQAYEYIKYAGGMDLETTYDYKAEDGPQCLASDGKIGAVVSEVYNITTGDEDDLVTAIANVGPVSIAYQVSPDFRFYQHGVYDSYNATTNSTMCNNTAMDVNHAVVAIGLGTTSDSKHNNNDDGGIPYYIVRNSWGTSWGMEGHFWMKRGENLCGVSDCASFPIVPRAKPDAKQEVFGEKSLLEMQKMKKLAVGDKNLHKKVANDPKNPSPIAKATYLRKL